MAGVALKYVIDTHLLEALLSKVEKFDTRPAFEEIGEYMNSEMAYRFRTATDADGNALIQSERAEREGGKTLVDRGHLRDSYTYNVFIDGSGVEQGSDMDYAAIHQFGGETGRNKATTLPARPVAGVNNENEDEINLVVHRHLRGVLK